MQVSWSSDIVLKPAQKCSFSLKLSCELPSEAITKDSTSCAAGLALGTDHQHQGLLTTQLLLSHNLNVHKVPSNTASSLCNRNGSLPGSSYRASDIKNPACHSAWLSPNTFPRTGPRSLQHARKIRDFALLTCIHSFPFPTA